MTTCSRCAISAWHPEARTCTLADCELRNRSTSLPAAVLETHGRPCPGGVTATGDFVGESVPNHVEGIAA